LPIVVLTGSSNDQELDAAFTLGADAFLVKPFHFRDLVRQIQDLWGRNNAGLKGKIRQRVNNMMAA
jgi:DNA-binding response OmpR family regulator